MVQHLVFFFLFLGRVWGSDVRFFLVTRNGRTVNKTIEIKKDDFDAVNGSCPIKLIVHGWRQSRAAPFYEEMTAAYLLRGDYNVIHVDWSILAAVPYVQASQNTKKAGEFLGEFISKLNHPLEDVHVIGHSLGAHVLGFAGKTIKRLRGSKIARISALDPAGPGFRTVPEDHRLSSEDAEMVDVTHTDINYFGYTSTMGTIDFYPNGGHRPQPGCEPYNPDLLALNSKQIAFCSHIKSCVYFIESINSQSMVGIECSSMMDYQTGKCKGNKRVEYGENTPKEARGVYYFSIDSKKLPSMIIKTLEKFL